MVCYGIFSSVELYQLQSARISGLEYLLKYKLLITLAYTFQSKNMAQNFGLWSSKYMNYFQYIFLKKSDVSK